jgi:hypothetical protein
MDERIFSTSMSPEVIIQNISGSLQVKGWERPQILVRAEPSDLTLVDKDDALEVSCLSDCSIRVPFGATIQTGQVYGEARFKLLEDTLSIKHVYGSLTLREVADATVEEVNGDLHVRQVNGDLAVKSTNGNAFLREMHGDCLLGSVNGNLDVKDVEGGVKAVVDGNIQLRLVQLGGLDYDLQAQGNIQCEIAREVDLSIKVISEGGVIRVRLPGNSQTLHQESLDLSLGKGTATMLLQAGGVVSISNLEGSWQGGDEATKAEFIGLPDDFSDRISRQVQAQIESQMETMTRQMNEQLSRMSSAFDRGGISNEEADRIMEETRQKSEQAAAQAEEKMRRAQEKLERKLESHRRRAEAQTEAAHRRAQSSSRRGWHFEWSPQATPPPPPPKPAASEEERLMILKMLEQKKLSLEEATQLLEALEGKAT